MKLVIIDYGSGNLRSAAKACARALADTGMQGDVLVSSDASVLKTASHIILPGVGAFGDCMQGLQAREGILDALQEQVTAKKRWFFGICVGMQLLFERGYEHGTHDGLGWLKGEVVKLTPSNPALKIPHMGWNQIRYVKNFPPFTGELREGEAVNNIASPPAPPQAGGIRNVDTKSADESAMSYEAHSMYEQQASTGTFVYFVHSYHAKCNDRNDILATTDYGGEVVAMVGRDNIFGTQFHPEKSQQAGLSLLANFMKL